MTFEEPLYSIKINQQTLPASNSEAPQVVAGRYLLTDLDCRLCRLARFHPNLFSTCDQALDITLMAIHFGAIAIFLRGFSVVISHNISILGFHVRFQRVIRVQPTSLFQPKNLHCTECGVGFIFSVGEQEFFALRNLANEPKRCPNCRLLLRFARTGRDTSTLSEVICADCERPTKVPFKPRGHRPIYCNECLAGRKTPGERQFDRDIELIAAVAGHA